MIVDSPPAAKSIKQPPGKFTTEAMAHLKKRKWTASEDDPDFEITPPPAKKNCHWVARRQSLLSQSQRRTRKRRPSLPRGKGKVRGKTNRRKCPLPLPQPEGLILIPLAPPLANPNAGHPQKQTPVGRRRTNPWCSSSSHEGGAFGIPYTLLR